MYDETVLCRYEQKKTYADRHKGLLTKLTDVIIGVGLWHGSDGQKGAAVPPQSFT